MNSNDVKPEKAIFDGNFKKIYNVYINPDEYEICVKAAANMWANKKTGSDYNKGLINTKQDPHRAERTGKLGEMAMGKIVGLPMDTEYRQFGDEQDFIYRNNKINVKCTSEYPSYEAGLTRCLSDKGFPIELVQDIYVYGYLKNENRQSKEANAVIIGYQTKEFIEKLEKVKARKGLHRNHEIPYADLICIDLIPYKV